MAARKLRTSPSGPTAGEKATLNFAAGTLPSHTATTVTTALTGVRTSDIVTVAPVSALPTGASLQGTARVVSAGVIEITFTNSTPANITGGSPTVNVLTNRFNA